MEHSSEDLILAFKIRFNCVHRNIRNKEKQISEKRLLKK
jgi:hypothetical protein